jgi:hypothetical protein
MKPLFHTSIYVNRASETLKKFEGKKRSSSLSEGKAWVTGKKIFEEARDSGHDVALIFAQYRELDYWAIATAIEIQGDGSTDYSFSNLQPIPNSAHKRSDLTVKSTGKRMSNNFIRSYAIVKTPQFLLQQMGK